MHLLKEYQNITLTVDRLNECDCDFHKKVGIELLYNSVHRKFNQLETRCGTESQHPAEGALRPPINQFGDQTSWRQGVVEKVSTQQNGPSDPQLNSCSWREDAGLRNMSQRGWAPRPPVEQPRRMGKKRGYGQ